MTDSMNCKGKKQRTRVLVMLQGELIDGDIVLRVNSPKCDKLDHFCIVLKDQHGSLQRTTVEIHPDQFEVIE